MGLSTFETILLYAIPVILAITLHEAAHGYVARMFGDDTAYSLGRVTLNPIKHIDPIGTIAVPLGMLLVSNLAGAGFVFGWAKPVPVNFANLHNPKSDMFWVAAAGPGANLFMALVWALVFKFTVATDAGGLPAMMAAFGIHINLVLMILNLIPIPPLDGGRIMVSILPMPLAIRFAQIERFGFIIVIVLMVSHVLDYVMIPLVGASKSLIRTTFGL